MNESFPYKRLYRSRYERVIFGVCGGLAEYFEIDPVWMRLLFIVLTLLCGTSIFLYLVMWIIVPLAPFKP
jgi:phage shock protein C